MVKGKRKPPQATRQLNPQQAGQLFKTQFAQGNFEAALNTVLAFCQRMPKHADAWSDAAATCIRLGRWTQAITYAKRALQLQPQQLVALDALAHAHVALNQYDEAQIHGLRALTLRDQQFGLKPPAIAHAIPNTFPQAGRKLIAFSLFGAAAKYCEGAVLNCLAQPTIYPGWQCLFYVDETVPASVLARLQNAGGQIVHVDSQLNTWPGPMWRFAAYDIADMACVIFRDTDSLINQREAQAVEAWLASAQGFHMMRDYGSHTELMLAGLWGVRAGALPAMQPLIQAFLSKPVASQHFADQFFLREYVWPYARQSILQHDSLFGFFGAQPFTNHQHQAHFHVGCNESTTYFEADVAVEDGTAVTWRLIDVREAPEKLVCCYQATAKQQKISVYLPRSYAHLLQSGAYVVRIQAEGAP